jgi:hypothetical protein
MPWRSFASRLITRTLNNLRNRNQCRLLVTEIHLQFETVLMLDNSPDGGILDLSVVQVHFDFVADLELA